MSIKSATVRDFLNKNDKKRNKALEKGTKLNRKKPKL